MVDVTEYIDLLITVIVAVWIVGGIVHDIKSKKNHVKIKLLCEDCAPEQHGDWIDLKSAENIQYTAGQSFMIPLGVAMEVPKGYEVHLVPRSSTWKNHMLMQTNSVGIVDHDYCGDDDELKMPVVAGGVGMIKKGERICQIKLVPVQPKVNFEYVETLGNKSRGGFGSTGK